MSQQKPNNNDDIQKLLNSANAKTQKFNLSNNLFLAKCVKCYDADTIHVVINFHNKLQRFVCRLAEIDTAEVKNSNAEELKVALAGKEFLENLILNKLIIIKCSEFDKYGRLLIYIYSFSNSLNDNWNIENNELENYVFENSINQKLIENNFGYKYQGKTKKKFEEWYKDK